MELGVMDALEVVVAQPLGEDIKMLCINRNMMQLDIT